MKIINNIPVFGDVQENALTQIQECAKTAARCALMADHHQGLNQTETIMDKTEANKRLAAIESEAEALRNAPATPAPVPGDVIQADGMLFIADDEGQAVNIGTGYRSVSPFYRFEEDAIPQNLGKHSEVFMRRDEVRKAAKDILNTKDSWGDSLARCAECNLTFKRDALKEVVQKLRKLAE